MAGNGPAPKPDSERRRTNRPTFEWTLLPASGRKGKTPPLPKWRLWHPETLVWWRALWRKPQATAWDQSGATLHPLATLYDDLISGREPAAKVSAEMRQHEDRHGLNPKSLLQLRWRIVPDADLAAVKEAAVARAGGARRDRLRVVS
jgi:hypothetical protein